MGLVCERSCICMAPSESIKLAPSRNATCASHPIINTPIIIPFFTIDRVYVRETSHPSCRWCCFSCFWLAPSLLLILMTLKFILLMLCHCCRGLRFYHLRCSAIVAPVVTAAAIVVATQAIRRTMTMTISSEHAHDQATYLNKHSKSFTPRQRSTLEASEPPALAKMMPSAFFNSHWAANAIKHQKNKWSQDHLLLGPSGSPFTPRRPLAT